MLTHISKLDTTTEFSTPERCSITELKDAPDEEVSIARARVAPGIRTVLHSLKDVDERYIVIAGRGVMEAGDLREEVGPGSVVFIPRDVPQRIENVGEVDLIFLCVNSPPFKPECYTDLETGKAMPSRP
jgi:mannose-6-phosphate isomerase-like protein (cupin superfamily)